jgi:hypothetical protein
MPISKRRIVTAALLPPLLTLLSLEYQEGPRANSDLTTVVPPLPPLLPLRYQEPPRNPDIFNYDAKDGFPLAYLYLNDLRSR